MGIFNKKFAIMLNIVLFGKPGAGKGTQAAFLKSQYDLVVLVIPLRFLTSSPNKSRVPTKPFLFNFRTRLMPSSSLSPATYTAAILPIINLGIQGDVLTTILFRMPIIVNVKVCLLF